MGANIYYNPEKFGLEIAAEIDYSDGNDFYDTRVVWWSKSDGLLFTWRERGCSCPVPFEDVTPDEIDRLDMSSLKAEVDEELRRKHAYITAMQAAEFLDKVREAVEIGA